MSTLFPTDPAPSRSHIAYLLLFAAPVVFGSWVIAILPSRWDWLLVILTWTCALALIWRPSVDGAVYLPHPPQEKAGRGMAWLAWVLLAAILIVSFFNPAYVRVPLSTTEFFLRRIEHWTFLPSCVIPSQTALKGALLIGQFLLGMLVIERLNRRETIRKLWMILFYNGVLLSLLGLWFKVTHAKTILGLFKPANSQFFATFHYHNHWGAFALLSLLAAVGLLLYTYRRYGWLIRSGNPGIFYVACAFPLGLSVPLGGGRGAILIFLLMLVIFTMRLLAGLFIRPLQGEESHRTKTGWRLLWLGVALAALLWTVYHLGADDLWRQFRKTQNDVQAIAQGLDPSMRLHAAEGTIRMAQVKPVWGWGCGSFAEVFPRYAPPAFSERGPYRMEYAHNDWLQLWAEMGILGAGLVLLIPFGWAVRCWGRNGFRIVPETRWMMLGIAALAVFAALDFPFGNPVTQGFLILMLATITHYATLHSTGFDGPVEE